MGKRVRNVIIDLRNLDGIVLEGETDKEDAGPRSRSSEKGPAVDEILKMHDKAMHRWNTLFIIVSCFGVFIDPLVCYIYVVTDNMCFSYDFYLLFLYLLVRSAVDVFYLIDIIIFFCGICKKCKGKRFGTCWKPRSSDEKTKGATKKVLKKGSLLRFSILPRIITSFPVTIVLLFGGIFGCIIDPFYVIIIFIPFQYTLRIFFIYGFQRWRPIKKTTAGRWLKLLLDFLPFILSSHLLGALWYRLAVQRQIDCWSSYFEEVVGRPYKSIDDFMCATRKYNQSMPIDITNSPLTNSYRRDDKWVMINSSRLQELCPTKDVNPKVFDFGIYLYAIQSNVIVSSSSPKRVLLSFWWALRNLSSFGSNLLTSMHPSEIFFSVVISITGMALFLVYLNARVQESQARSRQLKQNEKKHLMKPDIDLWLYKNDLCNLKTMTKDDSKDLQTMTKTNKALKTVIIQNIDKLEVNKDIDVRNIISILPVKFKRSIIRLLCLASLKKVPMLANLNATMLKVICEHLKPVIYTEDNCIVQEGKPLGMMLFITQGLAWSYTTNNVNGGGTRCGSSTSKWLKRGDFYGEELLNCAFKCPSFTDLPMSTRTVVSQEKVEAFALRASDLKGIVCKFWWHFTRELKQADLEQWENSAASSIQRAWRNHLARDGRSNRWDKFTVEY